MCSVHEVGEFRVIMKVAREQRPREQRPRSAEIMRANNTLNMIKNVPKTGSANVSGMRR